ncbi:MAG: HD domain-containing protein [Myxococcota bacterium]
MSTDGEREDVDANVGHHLGLRYTRRLDEAVALALHDFRRITRKASEVPYVSHLLAVTALVAEAGGDEDQLIAAVLHDWLEDVPEASAAALGERFGPRVRRIVEALTDTTEHPKPPWRARKEAFVAAIRRQPPEVKLVCCADKLHNCGTLVRDLRLHGMETLDRFRGGRQGTVWYYRAVCDALGDGFEHWLHGELDRTVAELEAATGIGGDQRA